MHVVPSYLPAMRYGGPIHSVHGLCKALVADGHEVHVFTTNVDGAGTSNVPVGEPVMLDGVIVTYFNTGFPRRVYRSPGMLDQMKKAIKGFDLVHIHAVFLWPGLAASRAAQKFGVPYVVSPRGMLVPELINRKSRLIKTAWIRLFDRNMIRRAAGIHVTSNREVEDMNALDFEVSQFINIPNGIEVPELSKPEIDEKNDNFILYLGRIDPKKGVDVLIESMRHLPNVSLVIGGDGEPDYVQTLKQQVKSTQLESQIEFTGHLDDTLKWDYYRRASMLVLPSISENFGNVVVEAMAMACPVVVSPGVGLAETVQKHECGLVVDRDPLLVAKVIQNLLNEPLLREKMGRNGEDVVGRQFSWDYVACQMGDAYATLVRGDHSETSQAAQQR